MSVVESAEWLAVPGELVTYRWQDESSIHPPDSPWFSHSRFCDGEHKVLYLAESAAGAVAEFLRRFPELIDFQDDLRIVVFEMSMRVDGQCLDLRSSDAAAALPIDEARLTSSEADERARYAECRAVAKLILDSGLTGLFYPSAATTWRAWNLVLFGDSRVGTWTCDGFQAVERPKLEAHDVRILAF